MQITPSRFESLGNAFFQAITSQPVQQASLLSINQSLAEQLAFNTDHSKLLSLLSGNPPQHGIATVYSGHQFGVYNPKLGDGRTMLLGETQDTQQQYWELQLKGSGQTPYSRFGDGRAVLRSSIREYLCSEAMHGLGIPTTRALALISSQTPVQRENEETAAIVLRAAPSFIRFGHFEYFFYTEQHAALKQLIDFTIQHYFADFQNNYAAWFNEVVRRTAHLIAQWQAQAFCHGVLNTDNMSILGLTIDYGPFAFMDDFNPRYICNHSDTYGRYSFQRQPDIGLWNLNALAHALSPFIALDDLKQALAQYEPTLAKHYQNQMLEKLGLLPTQAQQDDAFLSDFFQFMISEQVDYHWFLRQLSETPLTELNQLADDFVQRDLFLNWLNHYRQRLAQQALEDGQRMTLMQSKNPKYVLRNYLAQQAIEQAEKGDNQLLNDLLQVLQQPFVAHEKRLDYLSKKPPAGGKGLVLSCSS